MPNFFVNYEINQKPEGYTGFAVKVIDALGVTREIPFNATTGKLDKAVADAYGTDLKVIWVYDKSDNNRHAKIVSGSGDGLLRWNSKGIAKIVPTTADVRYQTDDEFTFSAPKIFSVAETMPGVETQLCELSNNGFAPIAPATPGYANNILGYAGSGQFSYAESKSHSPENAGMHQRTVLFSGSGSDKFIYDGILTTGTGATAAGSHTGKITLGNQYFGGKNGLHHFVDLKIIEGAISDADALALAYAQRSICRVAEENVGIFFGDSLSFSVDADAGNPEVVTIANTLSIQLQTLLGSNYVCFNEGHSGKTTGQLISFYLQYAIAKAREGKLNFVIVNGGFNDWIAGVPIATIKANLQTIVTAFKNAGVTVLIRTLPRSGYGGENYNNYNAWYAEMNAWLLAGNSGADFVINETGDPHIGATGNFNDPVYFYQGYDHLHGKAPYYAIIAALAANIIQHPPDDVTNLTVDENRNLTSDAAAFAESYVTRRRINGGDWIELSNSTREFQDNENLPAPGKYLFDYERKGINDGTRSANWSNIASRMITIYPPAPVAAFSLPASVYVGEPVALINQTTGLATQFEWRFNNAEEDSIAFEPENCVYGSSGTKTVKLIAGNLGGSTSVTHTITVLESFLAQHFEEFHLAKIFNITSLNLKMPLLEANFGAGYGVGILTAPASGLRVWSISSEMLPDVEQYQVNYTVDDDEFTDSRFQYFWEFYRRHVALGNKPFYFIDPRTGRRFLASFVEREISFEAMTAKLFRGGVVIRQRRVKLDGLTYRSEDASVEQY